MKTDWKLLKLKAKLTIEGLELLNGYEEAERLGNILDVMCNKAKVKIKKKMSRLEKEG